MWREIPRRFRDRSPVGLVLHLDTRMRGKPVRLVLTHLLVKAPNKDGFYMAMQTIANCREKPSRNCRIVVDRFPL